MSISRRKVVMTALAAAALLVLATQIGASNPGQGAVKLEGAWIAKVISYENTPVDWPVQWSTSWCRMRRAEVPAFTDPSKWPFRKTPTSCMISLLQ